MSDGYTLEVQADLDQTAYKRKLDKLIEYTRSAGQSMEGSLHVEADIIDNASRTIKKIQAEKIAPKDITLTADGARVTARVEAIAAEVKATHPEINVSADTSRAVEKIAAVEVAAKSAGVSGTNAGNGMASSFITAARGAEQVASRLGTIAIVAGAAGAAVATVATALVGGVGISAANTIEQAQLSLQTLIGDVPAANKLLKDFKTEADISPFELKDYAVTAAKFAAATDDVDEIRKRTFQAAKASAQYGGDLALVGKALADVSNKGKLAGQEVIQFANAGIPIQGLIARFLILNGTIKKMPLSDAIVQVGKLQEEGKVTAQVVRDALDTAIDPKIAEKFAKTLKGRLSTLKDAFKNTAAAFVGVDISNFSGENIVKPGGFYDTLGKSVTNLSNVFNSGDFKKTLQDAGSALGVGFGKFAQQLPLIVELLGQFFATSAKIVGKMFELGAGMIQAFGPKVQQAMGVIAEHSDGIAKALLALVAGGVGLKIAGMFLGILTPLSGLITGAGKFITTLGGLSGATAAAGASSATLGASLSAIGGVLLGPVGIGIVAVVALGAALFSAYSSSKKLRDELGGGLKLIGVGIGVIISGLKDAISGIFSALKPIGEALAPIFNVIVAAVGIIVVAVGGIAKAFGAVFQILGPIVGFVAKLLLVFSPIGFIVASIRYAWTKWGDEIKIVWGYVKGFFGTLGDLVGDVTNVIKKAVGAVSGFLSHIPIIGDQFEKSGKKGKKAFDEVGLSADKARPKLQSLTEEAQKFSDNINSYISTGLPEIDTTNVETIGKSFVAQIDVMKKRSSDISTILTAGYPDLLASALEAGGEQGQGLINQYVAAIKAGTPDVLEAIRQQLKEQAQVRADIEFALKQGEKERQGQAALNFFDTAPQAKKDFKATLDGINKQGDANKAEITKLISGKDGLLSRYSLSKDSAEGKAIIDRLTSENNAYSKINKARIDADARAKVLEEKTKETISRTVTPSATTTTTTPGATTTTKPVTTTPKVVLPPTPAETAEAKKRIQDFRINLDWVLADTPGKVAATGSKVPGAFFGGFLPTWDSIVKPKLKAKGDEISGLLEGDSKTGGQRFADAYAGNLLARLATYNSKLKAAGGTISSFIASGNVFSNPDTNGDGDPGAANGMKNWRGGPLWVGEKGPELLNLPRGSDVMTNQESMKVATPTVVSGQIKSAGSQQGNVVIENVHGVSFEDAMERMEAQIRAKRRQVFA
jgi:tape measure protein